MAYRYSNSIIRNVILCLLVLSSSSSSTSQSFGQTAKPESAQAPEQAETPESNELDQKEAKQAKDEKANSDPTNDFDHFIRISRDRKGRPVAMQTSVTRYEVVNEDGNRVTVDLVGVIHVGEKEYYAKFNEIFENYDAVLYELVAPEGTVIPKGGRMGGGGMNPIAGIQKGMQTALELEFQLEHIDYTKDNFVHADMTPEEFSESMKKNEESIGKMVLRAMGQSMAMQQSGGAGDAEMLMAMFSRNRALRLRRAMATQMKRMESGLIMFDGKEGSTIINHRNAKAMEVLKREIDGGKKNIAIFYGAGHLDDMQRRLQSDFKMKRGGQFWLDAWKLTKRPFKR